MTAIELFTEVFGENVFDDPRTQERTDKRTGAYYYMKKVMGMTHHEIAKEVGRNHSTVGVGAKRFKGLLEIGDPGAMEIWRMVDDGIKRILAHTDGEILSIDGNWYLPSQNKNNRLEWIKMSRVKE